MSLKQQLSEDMKGALRAKESARLSALRLLLAAVRQKEIDERIELDDAGFVGVVEKLIKQRKDAVAQYLAAHRQDLADKEQDEIGVLGAYMPQPFTEEELAALIGSALAETGAASAKDMGKVMAWLKPRLAGRADMGAVSARIKSALA
ncbi:GatB/YqeY domain-containing protein [Parasulfuritortus cantonensis]|uniref:GatB/YqeY domain-containing protein n=1 Tax=Parasulfuritortus cantonensis TaxID=2528202 RepID=A0A4R1BGI8_9PROT|nr:GatB/YqeY domain-containing protein [Parasulfuritortus cantonensis]TCJ16264.1 GatB/YqeY domain-containing protein [Parasulfuritortus cantonensis]